MVYRGPEFLAVIVFGSLAHSLLHPPSRQQVVSASQTSCVLPAEVTDGKGGLEG